ncbi:MAG TPA: hypothetical protein DCG51_08860 [Erysipelotrichaceae bacterium]|nr:hypothetical protein [Erysipelotrichaceae bacterium]
MLIRKTFHSFQSGSCHKKLLLFGYNVQNAPAVILNVSILLHFQLQIQFFLPVLQQQVLPCLTQTLSHQTS